MSTVITTSMNVLPSFTNENTILIDDGIYENINLTINNKGTISKPIIIKPKNNGKVIFSGTVNIKISGEYIILSNIIFTNGKGSIQLEGSNNRITNCEFSLNDGLGPVLSVTRYNNRIDHNIFKDFPNFNPWVQILHEDDTMVDNIIIDSNVFMNRKKGTGNGFETIRFGLSGTSLSPSNSVIENNIFENCNGEIEIVSNKAGGNIYYKNTFKTSYGSLTLRHGNNVLVAKNKFLQNNAPESGGVRVAAGSGHIVYNNLFKNTNNRAALIINSGTTANDIYNIPVSHSKFLKNIFLDCTLDILIGSQYPIAPRNCEMKDNIIIKNSNDPVYQIESSTVDFDFYNNIYKVNNMGNIPAEYNQKIYENAFHEQININNFGSSEVGTTNIFNNIIFDDKYGSEYYKYLNKLILDEINGNTHDNSTFLPPIEPTDITILPSSGMSYHSTNPFLLLLCVFSFTKLF